MDIRTKIDIFIKQLILEYKKFEKLKYKYKEQIDNWNIYYRSAECQKRYIYFFRNYANIAQKSFLLPDYFDYEKYKKQFNFDELNKKLNSYIYPLPKKLPEIISILKSSYKKSEQGYESIKMYITDTLEYIEGNASLLWRDPIEFQIDQEIEQSMEVLLKGKKLDGTMIIGFEDLLFTKPEFEIIEDISNMPQDLQYLYELTQLFDNFYSEIINLYILKCHNTKTRSRGQMIMIQHLSSYVLRFYINIYNIYKLINF